MISEGAPVTDAPFLCVAPARDHDSVIIWPQVQDIDCVIQKTHRQKIAKKGRQNTCE
jgi:hypothetical protein